VQAPEAGHLFEVLQTGVGDRRVGEPQIFEPFEVLQTGTGDLRAVEVQAPEAGHLFEVLQTGVGDLRVMEPDACHRTRPIQFDAAAHLLDFSYRRIPPQFWPGGALFCLL
jgi:hypothetical protein